MLEYIVILLILCYFSYTRKTAYLSLLLLLVLSIFRSTSVGIDLEAYISEFIGERDINIEKAVREPGYYLFTYIIGLIRQTPRFYIFATSILIIFPIFFFIKKNLSKQVSFGILIFYLITTGFVFSLSGIRQSISIAIFIWSVYYFEKKHFLYSTLLFLLAASFHNSVLFCFPILLLANYSNSKMFHVITLIFSGILGLFISLNVYDIVGQVQINVANIYAETYSNYASDIKINLRGKIMLIIPNTIIALICIKKDLDGLYLKLFIWGVILTNIFVSTPMIFRYSAYLTIFQIIIIPKLLEVVKFKYVKYTIIAYFILNFIFFILYATLEQNIENNYVPYKSIFEE